MSWENSLDDVLFNPPDDDMPVFIDSFGNEVFEGESYYDIDGLLISEDALEEVKFAIVEDEPIICEYCEEDLSQDESLEVYFRINGKCYCERCIEDCIEYAEKD